MGSSQGTPGALDACRLTQALAALPGLDDWRIETRREESAQLYLSGRQLVERRSVMSELARVVLYNDHAGDRTAEQRAAGAMARGEATLTLLARDIADPDRLAAQLTDALAMARLTDNPPFALPGQPARGYPAAPTADPVLLGDLGSALDGLREQLEAAVAAERAVRLASAELYATRGTYSIHNSRGLEGGYEGTRVDVDLVLIASDGVNEAEFHAAPCRRRLADLPTEGMIAAYASFARDSLRAVLPATHAGPVILSGEALPELFSPLVFHTSARAAFQHVSRLTPGAPVTSNAPRGDRMTLRSDGLRPFGNATAPYDTDGLPSARVALIEAGVFVRPWADVRYAAYLGIPATGGFANLALDAGETPLATLRAAEAGPVYEIVAFSWLNPDAISGNFVAEIKLGYRHDASGSVPIKGGSVSGNVFAALGDARFAAEMYSDGAYHGPAAIRFEHLSIAGS